MTNVNDAPDRTLLVAKQSLEAAIRVSIAVALTCLVVLMLAGTFGILHNGDDFSFDFPSSNGRGGGD